MPMTAPPLSQTLTHRALPATGSISAKNQAFIHRCMLPLVLNELTGKIRELSQAGAAYLFIDTAPSVGAVNAGLFAPT
jgi:hypothetical protein